MLRAKSAELEVFKNELIEQIENSKVKARNLLIKKDIQIEKIKLIVHKLQNYLKTQMNLSQSDIQQIGIPNEEELLKLEEKEAELESQEDLNST